MTDDIVERLRSSLSQRKRWPRDRLEAADEIERLRARICLLEGFLNGALNVVERFVACDTSDARAALEGRKAND